MFYTLSLNVTLAHKTLPFEGKTGWIVFVSGTASAGCRGLGLGISAPPWFPTKEQAFINVLELGL